MAELSAEEIADFTESIARSHFRLSQALLFYEIHDPKELTSYTNGTGLDHVRSFVMIHNVRDGQLCEGAPVTRKALMSLCAKVLPSLSETIMIPPNLLAFKPGVGMAWWTPAGTRKLYFDESTKIRSGTAPVPALLFVVHDGEMNVWALDTNERPALSSLAYEAPFFNLFEFGMCAGDVRMPEGVDVSDISKWEKVLFNSYFTNESPPKLKGVTAKDLWDSLIDQGVERFPTEHLVRRGTVKTALGVFG